MTGGKSPHSNLSRRSEINGALKRINEQIHSSLDSRDIIERLLAEGGSTLGCDSAALSVRTDEGWVVKHVWRLPEDMVGRVMSDAEGPHAVLAIEKGEPVLVSDVRNDPRVNCDHLIRHNIGSLLTLPLISGPIRRGVVFFNYADYQHEFGEHDLDFVQHLTITTAIALENSHNHHEHVLAEQALRASEKRLQEVMAACNIFSFDWSLATDIISRSPNAIDILGDDFEGELAQPAAKYLEQVHPEDRDNLRRVFANLKPENPFYEIEYRFRRADGRVIWLQENGNAFFDEQGPLSEIHGISKDITDIVDARIREKNAATTLAAEASAVKTIDAMGEGVALLATDGTIKNVNPAFASFAGIDREHLKGQNIHRVLPSIFEESLGEISDSIEVTSLKQSSLDPNHALCIARKDGSARWVVPRLTGIHTAGGQNVPLVFTIRDVTPLIETRESLRQSQDSYRQLVENARSLIIHVDTEHRLRFCNEFAQQFFGYSQEELIGRNELEILLPPNDSEREQYINDMAILKADPDKHSSFENQTFRSDGTSAWVYWTNKAILNDDGEIEGVLRIGTDITERKVLEEENERYSSRLQRLAELLATAEEQTRRQVSSHIHDTVVQSLSLANIHMGALRSRAEGDFEAIEQIDNIRSQVEQAISDCRCLMSDLTPPLLYEKGLASALRGFAAKQSKLQQVEIAVEAEDPTESVSDSLKAMLFQAARELVMNALKHADPSKVSIAISTSDSSLKLAVTDDGHGFNSDEVNLFDANEKGGFGLFNIWERLNSVGGIIRLESIPQDGTKAMVEVPLEPHRKT